MEKFIYSPCDGEIIKITDVKDPIFAKKMLGDGICIVPSGDNFSAPCDGEISVVLDTKHAYGFKNQDFEILMHIGINTIELKGKGFSSSVKKNDKVKQGQPIVDVDLKFLKKHKYLIDTPIVFVNNPNLKFKILKKGKIKQGDKILQIL